MTKKDNGGRRERTHLLNDANPTTGFAPKHISNKEFGQRVYRLMIAKGWNQAELSRRAGLTRDSISTYIRGLTYPSAVSVSKLASALGVDTEQLMPNHIEHAIEKDDPSFEMKISTVDHGRAWVRLNRLLPTSVAVQIVTLIEAAANSNDADRD